MPNIILPVALSMVWKYFYNPSFGIINNILKSLGLNKIEWFSQTTPAFFMIVLFVVWQTSGYCILLLNVAIRNIPQSVNEASILEGASPWQTTTKITIPLISPTLYFLAVTCFIGIFQIFDPIVVITNGGPTDSTRSIMFSIYQEVASLRVGPAAAISWMLFLIIAVITLIQTGVQKKWVHYDL